MVATYCSTIAIFTNLFFLRLKWIAERVNTPPTTVNNKSVRASCGTAWLFAAAIIVAVVASGVAATFRYFMTVKRRDIWCEAFAFDASVPPSFCSQRQIYVTAHLTPSISISFIAFIFDLSPTFARIDIYWCRWYVSVLCLLLIFPLRFFINLPILLATLSCNTVLQRALCRLFAFKNINNFIWVQLLLYFKQFQ